MIGNDYESVSSYHTLFTFLKPWTYRLLWFGHNWDGTPYSLVFYSHAAEEDEVKREVFFLPVTVRKAELMGINRAQMDFRSPFYGDIEFYTRDGCKIAVYLKNLPALICRDLTHAFTAGGIYLLKAILDAAENLNLFPEIKKTADLTPFCPIHAQLFLRLGDRLYKIKSDGLKLVESGDLLRYIFKGYEKKVVDLYTALTFKIEKVLENVGRGTLAQQIICEMLERGYVIFHSDSYVALNQSRSSLLLPEGFYTLFPFDFDPKRFILNKTVYEVPERIRKKYRMHGYIAYKIEIVRTGFRIRDAYITTRTKPFVRYRRTLPHYSPDGGVCLGDVRIQMTYEKVPDVEEFIAKTHEPLCRALNTINLEGAWRCRLTEELIEYASEREAKKAAEEWVV